MVLQFLVQPVWPFWAILQNPREIHGFWAGLGWAGLAGLGWAGLGWAGLGWAGLGWAGLGWAGLGWAGLGWAGLGWAGLGWAGLGWAGLGWAGLGWDLSWDAHRARSETHKSKNLFGLLLEALRGYNFNKRISFPIRRAWMDIWIVVRFQSRSTNDPRTTKTLPRNSFASGHNYKRSRCNKISPTKTRSPEIILFSTYNYKTIKPQIVQAKTLGNIPKILIF